MSNLFFATFSLSVPLFVPTLFFLSLALRCDESVVRVNDLISTNEKVPIHLLNLSLASFGVDKRPFCDSEGHSAIQLPGFLQILSGISSAFVYVSLFGDIFLSRPLPPLNVSALRLALTLEQNSVWVGRICDKGQSQSAFLSDDFCTLSLCSVLPEACKSMEALASKFSNGNNFPLRLPLGNLFPTDRLIALEPVPQFPLLEGYWKAEAQIQFHKSIEEGKWKIMDEENDDGNWPNILTWIGTENWHFVSLGDETNDEL